MKTLNYMFICLLVCLSACKQDKIIGPNEDDGTIPGPVLHTVVENLPGGAKISYTLPNSSNMLYVKAEYAIREGIVREVKASYHKNFLMVEGFPDTREYDVKLYTVSRGEKSSEPVIVKINPQTPPVQEAFRSLELGETFGGISISFQNSSAADLRAVLLVPDSLGALKETSVFYTKMPAAVIAARGFESMEKRFGVYIKDRFDNRSDTLFATLTPLYEKELDKSKFKAMNLAGDYNSPNNSGRSTMDKLWDGILGSNVENMFSTLPGGPMPQRFTFDLGVEASLSRFVYYPRANGSFAYTNQPRLFEIWGTNNPASDDSWVKLRDCEMIKPSGSSLGVVTDEDRAYATAGITYEFPVGVPKVRYIRFQTNEVWSGANIAILELTFFGSDQ